MTRPAPPEGGLVDRHEPGLDGLRAVSIGLVLAYHGDVGWARGGFLGISVFFALSGFLVTSVLLRSDRAGGIDPRAFWARRIRRLFPASMAALVVVAAYAAAAGTRAQVDALPGQALAAAANVANWRFIADGTSYTARFEAPSPVLHYWSLSVEEQFYLVAPLALGAVLGARRWRRHLLGIALTATAAAALWGAWLHHRGAGVDRLYYGTDVRAAEILVGVVAAVALHRLGRGWIDAHRRPLGAGGAAALVGLGALAVTTDLADASLWRGGLVLCAVLTVTAIAGVLARWGPSGVLAREPLPALGRISYGVYLYHFPVYLWLSPGRVDLPTWPLLGLRVAVTLVLATASYHLLEMPVRRGWTPPVPRRWAPAAAPLAALGVLVLVAAGTAASDATARVALQPSAASRQPPAVPVGDGTLDVLTIGDDLGRAAFAPLAAAVAGDPDIDLVDGPAFTCGGGVGDGAGGTVCRSWVETWPEAVAAADPDVVVLHVTGWGDDEIARDLDARSVAEVAHAIDGGLDLLVAGGATVWWAAPTEGLVFDEPLFRDAMHQLLARRPDLRRLPGMPAVDHDGAAYTAAAVTRIAAHLRQLAASGPGGVRIMLVGDSQVASVGTGLERWGRETGGTTVWTAALHGCPLLLVGELRYPDGGPAPLGEHCQPGQMGWSDAARRFDPDVVVVMAALDDLADRRLPGVDGTVRPGDTAFDAAALAEWTTLVDALSASGARVAWLTSPCVRAVPLFPGASPDFDDDPGRPAAVNELVEQVQAARPDVVEVVDAAELLCPGGTFRVAVDGVGELRADGVHLDEGASLWLAEQLGPRLVALAGSG